MPLRARDPSTHKESTPASAAIKSKLTGALMAGAPQGAVSGVARGLHNGHGGSDHPAHVRHVGRQDQRIAFLGHVAERFDVALSHLQVDGFHAARLAHGIGDLRDGLGGGFRNRQHRGGLALRLRC
ncbi:hypothetical protein G6F68_019637 [Rhizopus microsporus]|nr:hypothetical protein G6F68_019637 [Rhizopus microsporus]